MTPWLFDVNASTGQPARSELAELVPQVDRPRQLADPHEPEWVAHEVGEQVSRIARRRRRSSGR